jgi:hypothetical protein
MDELTALRLSVGVSIISFLHWGGLGFGDSLFPFGLSFHSRMAYIDSILGSCV